MKIQIDLTAKTIKLESNVNFGEFVTKMQEMFSDWKEYNISTNTTIQWKEYPVWIYREYNRNPWWCSTNGSTAIGTTLTTTESNGINRLTIGGSMSALTASSPSGGTVANTILNVEI